MRLFFSISKGKNKHQEETSTSQKVGIPRNVHPMPPISKKFNKKREKYIQKEKGTKLKPSEDENKRNKTEQQTKRICNQVDHTDHERNQSEDLTVT